MWNWGDTWKVWERMGDFVRLDQGISMKMFRAHCYPELFGCRADRLDDEQVERKRHSKGDTWTFDLNSQVKDGTIYLDFTESWTEEKEISHDLFGAMSFGCDTQVKMSGIPDM